MKACIWIFLMVLAACAPKPKLENYVPHREYTNDYYGIRYTLDSNMSLAVQRGQLNGIFGDVLPRKSSPEASPLFVGIDKKQKIFIRCLAENTEMDFPDYLEAVYIMLRDESMDVLDAKYNRDSTAAEITYRIKDEDGDFTFYERLTKHKGYALRLSLWSFTAVFKKYLPEMKQQASQISFYDSTQAIVKSWKNFEGELLDSRVSWMEYPAPEPGEGIQCPENLGLPIWELKGETNTVYLMGSIHFGTQDLYPLHAKMMAAWNQSQNFVVEVDIKGPELAQAMQAKMLEMKEKKISLKKRLSPPAYKALSASLAEMGLNIADWDQLDIWLALLTLQQLHFQKLGIVPEYGLENHFYEHLKDSMKVLQLESPGEQINLLSESLNTEKYLVHTINSLNTLKPKMKFLLRAWKCGDLDYIHQITFEDLLSDPTEYKEMYDLMLYQRNKKLAKGILEFLKAKENYFVMVGIGHLVGPESVVDILSQEGASIRQMDK